MQTCLFHIGAVHIKVSWSGLGGLSHLVRSQLLMMTLKISRNAKLPRALTDGAPVRPSADDDFEIYWKRQIDTCFNRPTSSVSCS